MSRLKSSAANFAHGLVVQIVQVLSQLLVRTFFASQLGLEYVGLLAFLMSAVGVLTIAELGAGVAFGYLLYGPVARGDTAEITRLVNWFGRFYRVVAGIMLVLGLALAPLVVSSLDTRLPTTVIVLGYTLFVLDLALGYVFAHFRTLIVADQQERVISRITTIVTLGKTLAQVIVLLLLQDFVLFIGVQILSTLTTSVMIARAARARYPFLRDYIGELPTVAERKEIRKRLSAMFLHRMGAAVAGSTDYIVLGVVSGLSVVGGIANYKLILASVDKVLGAVTSALAASVGNLAASGDRVRSHFLFRVVFLANAWATLVVFCAFLASAEAIVELWLGPQFVIDDDLVFWLGVNFFVRSLRRPINTFKTSYGLFVRDRYRPLAEALVSLSASLVLVNFMGPVGVLIGTFVGFLVVNAWLEPTILYRDGFRSSPRSYFVMLGATLLVTIAATGIATGIAGFIPVETGLLATALKIVTGVLSGTLLPLGVIWRTQEFAEMRRSVATIAAFRRRGL